jgi:hypothetical protein
MKHLLLTFQLLLISILAFSQDEIESKDTAGLLYQNGQIYLVVLVLFTIFVGIIFFLIKLDKKLTALEKKN